MNEYRHCLAIVAPSGGTKSHLAGMPAYSAHLRRSGRFGDPAESGGLCADLWSAQAAYITGQNQLIDGGAYPGTY